MKLKLDICDVPIQVSFEREDFYKLAKDRYSAYLTNKKPEITIYVHGLVDNLTTNLTDIREMGPQVITTGEMFPSRITIIGSVEAEIDLGVGEGICAISIRATAFDSFLRILYTIVLLIRGGFLIHSIGLKINTQSSTPANTLFCMTKLRKRVGCPAGILFPGKSGSGKTTLAGLVEKIDKRLVLSDELVYVKEKLGRFYIGGTPFWGEFRKGESRLSLPLRGIFFLRRNIKTALYCRKVSFDDAVIRLLKLILFFSDDLSLNKLLLNLAYKLAKKIPTYEICYDKDRVGLGEISDVVRKSI